MKQGQSTSLSLLDELKITLWHIFPPLTSCLLALGVQWSLSLFRSCLPLCSSTNLRMARHKTLVLGRGEPGHSKFSHAPTEQEHWISLFQQSILNTSLFKIKLWLQGTPPWSKQQPQLLVGTLLGIKQLIPTLKCFYTMVFMLLRGWTTWCSVRVTQGPGQQAGRGKSVPPSKLLCRETQENLPCPFSPINHQQ